MPAMRAVASTLPLELFVWLNAPNASAPSLTVARATAVRGVSVLRETSTMETSPWESRCERGGGEEDRGARGGREASDTICAGALLAASEQAKPRTMMTGSMASPRATPSLTLVGTPRFRPFRNVWMLEELREVLPSHIRFGYHHLPAAPHSQEARAHHPMGKVPSLLVRDGAQPEFSLIESAAINSWLGDRMREYVLADSAGVSPTGFLVPQPGSRDRALYDSFVQFLMAEADSSGLWIHRKLETLGEKKAFGAVRYALLPARLQFDRAMVGILAQLEKQREAVGEGSTYFWVGGCFTAADILLVHCCDWAASIEVDKGGWFSKYTTNDVFQDYLREMRGRAAYVRAKEIQERSPDLT
ncbi:MAG: hypothetical protein SGPRY_013943 [Prymnesium sp.]